MLEKINKLNEQEAKQLLCQLTELLKENDVAIYNELVTAVEMATLFR
jgi:hypothetical protein